MWNLCLPRAAPTASRARALSNLDYAPLAEAMGRLPWSAEVFNCNAPGQRQHGTVAAPRVAGPAQAWLAPLLAGDIRSAFAMSEPDVASSDPTNLQTLGAARRR